MITTKNGINYEIDITENHCDVKIPTGENQLPTEVVLADLTIRSVFDNNNVVTKYVIETIHYQFDIAPDGKRINRQRRPTHITTEVDAKDFELGFVGQVLKKSIVNGIFKSLGIADRAFDATTFELITNLD